MLVPAKGVERWLSPAALPPARAPRRARGDGVCAGVEFRSPRSLVAELLGHTRRRPVGARRAGLAAARGARRLASTSRGRARSRGTSATSTPAPRPSSAGAGATPSRARLAGLFASYAVQRPQLLADWLDGRATDGAGGDLDDDLAWQPPLWRALVEPGRRTAAARAARRRPSPGSRRAGAVRPARRGSPCSATPGCRSPRSSCSPRWPRTTTCTSGCRTPAATSGSGCADLRRRRGRPRRRRQPPRGRPPAARHARPRQPRAAARPSAPCRPTTTDTAMPGGARHPARLAAGRPARRRRRPEGRAPRRRRPLASRCTRCHGAGPPGRGAPRGAARAARGRPDPRAARHPGDVPRHRDLRAADHRRRSASVTSSRAATRPTGCGSGSPTGRSPRPTRCSASPPSCSTSPAAGPPRAQVLDLAAGRAGPPPLRLHRRRPRHRSPPGCASPASAGGSTRSTATPFGWPTTSQNTWRFGLDRVLTGVAHVRRRAGLARHRRCRSTTSAATGSSWPAGSPSTSTGCVAATDRLDRHPAARRLARRAAPTASTALTQVDRDDGGRSARCSASSPRSPPTPAPAADTPLRLTDVRALLGDHLAGRPTRANFRTGTPDRLHDGADALGAAPGGLPARPRRRGLPAVRRWSTATTCWPARPVTGERDVRSRGPPAAARRDRRRHRDAGRHLHRRRRAHRPAAAARRTPRRAARRPRPHHRRRRSATASWSSTRCSRFDRATSSPAGSAPPAPFTFDPTALVAAPRPRPAPGRRAARSSPGRWPLPAADDVALADLVAFFRDPVKGFFRALDLTLPWDVDGVSDAMPVEIDNLETWGGRRPDARATCCAASTPTRPCRSSGAAARCRPGQLGWRNGDRDPRAAP